MVAMGVMQLAVVDEVDMVAMGGLVMLVIGRMDVGVFSNRILSIRIAGGNLDPMLVGMVLMHRMQMAVMKVVGMIAVCDGVVATVGPVGVCMPRMDVAGVRASAGGEHGGRRTGDEKSEDHLGCSNMPLLVSFLFDTKKRQLGKTLFRPGRRASADLVAPGSQSAGVPERRGPRASGDLMEAG